METQRGSTCLQCWPSLLLLLGLAVPPTAARVFGYQEAILRAVDGINQRSSDASLYRLLELGQLPDSDENPDTPKPVSFTVQETVCPRKTQRPPEECNFKENGLVKYCTGTVTLDQTRDFFNINCDKIYPSQKITGLGERLWTGGKEIWRKIARAGQKIKDFFKNLPPRTAS